MFSLLDPFGSFGFQGLLLSGKPVHWMEWPSAALAKMGFVFKTTPGPLLWFVEGEGFGASFFFCSFIEVGSQVVEAGIVILVEEENPNRS